jgi:hypothetical protein
VLIPWTVFFFDKDSIGILQFGAPGKNARLLTSISSQRHTSCLFSRLHSKSFSNVFTEMLFLGVDLTNLTLACCELFVLRSMIEEYNNDSIGIVSDEQNK